MDITRNSFPFELVKILVFISECHFVAFDLEFSGITSRRNREGPKGRSRLTLQEVYEDTKTAAEKYQVLQVGLTVVQEDIKNGCYIARPYNFYINPLPNSQHLNFERIWSFQSGAVDFLNRHGFDFAKPYTSGIPYLSRRDETEIWVAWVKKDAQASALEDIVVKDEDQPLITHLRESIKDWQDSELETKDDFLNIPNQTVGKPLHSSIHDNLNRYQVRLIHQIVRSEYPGLKSSGKGHFVQLTTRSGEKNAAEKSQKFRYRERDIQRATEFRWMIEGILGGNITNIPTEYFLAAIPEKSQAAKDEAILQKFITDLQNKLKNRRNVLVGHNCFTDLVNLYTCFIGELPETVEAFREEIRNLFPAIVDTKYLASFDNRWSVTDLEGAEKELRTESAPRIEIPAEFDRYLSGENNHEAGYDSLLTAKIAIKLSARLEREGKYYDGDKKASNDEKVLLLDLSEEEGDVYVTAPESATDDEPAGVEFSLLIKAALTAPVTAIGKVFKGTGLSKPDETQESAKEEAAAAAKELRKEDREEGEGAGSSVLVVRTRPAEWSNAREIQKMKVALSQSSSGHLLDDENSADPGWSEQQQQQQNTQTQSETDGQGSNGHGADADAETEDLLVWSDEEDDGREDQSDGETAGKEKSLEEMLAKGDLMPRWDNPRGFWHRFGNRLQVNSSEEGVFILTT